MRHLRVVFSREVATVVIGYTLAILLAISFAEAFLARQEAVNSLAQARTNAIRRIDQLQNEISYLQARLRNTAVRDARERGRLEDAVRALAEQIRQAGGVPVTTGREPSPQPEPTSPRATGTASPRPHPTGSPSPRPKPSPSPSPSCFHVNPLGHSIHIC